MAKAKTVFFCEECGYETAKWMGKCPSCNQFNTMVEMKIKGKGTDKGNTGLSSGTLLSTLKSIDTMTDKRIKTHIAELDRVLSGGIISGSLMLIGGEPGIGKSTLILQICQEIGQEGLKILYISGEESAGQIKLRADRLGIDTENLFLLGETCLEIIDQTVSAVNPDLLIIDSIQTIYSEEVASVPGSVGQVRQCTAKFMNISKIKGISTIIVGHVTKEGSIAGPKILEHMVDTVLYFEGDSGASYRILRAAKNRFGSTNEIGVFEMGAKGLREIKNPSEYMLSGRPLNVPGSVITCSVEGTRPILAEVQALISQSNFGNARRTSTGPDYNRVAMLLAVLEKRAGLLLGSFDSYVNIAGGMKIVEPSLDAAVLLAIASSYKNVPVNPYLMVFGEIGLTGEMRAVSMAERRVMEGAKLGFTKCIMPKANLKGLDRQPDMEITGVSTINELLAILSYR